MAGSASGKRYAQAVMEIALEQNKLDEWYSSLARIAEMVAVPEARAFLENSRVDFNLKRQFVEATLQGVAPGALNLVYLLITKGKTRVAPQIAEEFDRLRDVHYGIEHATMTTATPLDAGLRDSIVKGLEDWTKHKVVATAKVDPSIIGGLVLRINGKLIDGSVRTRLESLRKNLAGTGK